MANSEADQQKSLVRVERAAILGSDGVVYSVPRPGRHNHVIRLMSQRHGWQPGDGPVAAVRGSTQGFVLSDGSFATREHAARVAFEAGQIDAFRMQGLYSEDLW
jgi:hypothetical protein